MVASVPELTRRTLSTAVRLTMASASFSSPTVGVPKLKPSATAFCTASTICGCALPWIIGPKELTRSTYSLPSTSHRREPLP